MKRSGIRAVWAFFLAVQLCCFSAGGTQQPNPSSLQQSESDGIAVPAGPRMEEAGALGKILDFKQVCGSFPKEVRSCHTATCFAATAGWYFGVCGEGLEQGVGISAQADPDSGQLRDPGGKDCCRESDDAREDPFRLVCLTDRRLFWMTADETALDVMSTEIEGGEIFT